MSWAWQPWTITDLALQPVDATYRLQNITRPSGLAIDFPTVCQHLRIGSSTGPEAVNQQTLIQAMIAAAAGEVERYCDMAVLTQKWRLFTASLTGRPAYYYSSMAYPYRGYDQPRFLLPKPPLASVDLVSVDGNTVNASLYTVVRDDRLPGSLVIGSSFPMSATALPNSIIVEFTCGYATAAAIPPELVQAMLLMIGTWFMNRESAMAYTLSVLPEIGVMDLLAPYKSEVLA